MTGILQEKLGLRAPILQAPMAGVQDSGLAIAVHHGGGLGALPCGMLTHRDIEIQLEILKAKIGTCYNVNFFTHKMPDLDPAADEAIHDNWQEMLRPIFNDFNTDLETVIEAPPRRPFDHEALDILARYKPAVVSFHFGLPDSHSIETIKSWGGLVISSATTVEEAVWLERNGADAIIAQGWEAGGHRGHFLSDDLNLQMGIFALLPRICALVSVPVIAAGGVASPQHVAALRNMGADAVQIGTSYLLCHECKISNPYRAALTSKISGHTAVTNIFSGRPARGIVNEFMTGMGYLREDVPPFPMAGGLTGALKKITEATGIYEYSNLWAGQNTSGCQEISAKELTEWFSAT